MKIYAPNIHLFAFQLYKGSNLDPDTISNDVNFIWERGDTIVKEVLQQDLQLSKRIDVKKQPEFTKVDILKDAQEVAVYFEGNINPNSQQDVLLKGFTYPCRISDSYGLWLNLRRPEQENNQRTEDVETDFLQYLNPKNCLVLPEHPLFLGQTLLITACLKNAKDKQHSQQIADEQARAGGRAAMTSLRFSVVGGGLMCIGFVISIAAVMPAFRNYGVNKNEFAVQEAKIRKNREK